MNRLFYLTTILGLLLIILNIFFDLSFIPEIPLYKQSLRWILTVISKASSTIGLALLLGNLTKLFNKKDEEEKESSRKKELTDIVVNTVVSKNFLQTLSTDNKKDIIFKLLTPENNSLNKHSNVQEYLNAKSDKYLNFFNINFRSNMNIDIKVSKDISSTTDRYVAKYKIFYRIYKIDEHYQPIYIMSEKSHKILDTVLKDNEGKKLKTIKGEDLTQHNGSYVYEIPKEYYKYNFITVERTVIEYGYSHWISVNWRSLTPIEGIILNVSCESGIIKEYQIFDNISLYDEPDLSEDRKNITIKSSQWLDPHTGICLIIANPSVDDKFDS
ncbi:MAG: hypothetical protein J6C96_01170 [Oscillospiraceae bacterium]|nr:hypothetical protein [Oscillospiraceae bacterium]